MKMKKVLAIGLCLMMTVGMTACGNSKNAAPAEADKSQTAASASSSAETAETTEAAETASTDALTVNIWAQPQLDGIQEICDDWTAESGIPVKVEVVDWNNYWTLLESGASGGTLPDVFWMHSSFSQVYMENDVLLDLTGYIKESGLDTSIYYQDILDCYVRDDGNIYALPKDHDTIALLYNKALFDEAGVEYPTDDWTYEDMYEAAKKITENTADDTYGMAMNTSNDQDGWYNYVYAYGGTVTDPDHKDTSLDSEGGKAGMEMVRKMLTVSTPQSIASESGTDSLFLSGKIGMITQGTWMISAYYGADNADDYAWALLPYADVNGDGQCQKEERQSCYNGLGWSAAANTANPDAAYSLIQYLCSKDAQIKQAELGVTMAGMPGISETFAKAFDGMDVSVFDRIEEEGTLYAHPRTRNSGEWKSTIEQSGYLLDAWQNPEDAALMETAVEKSAELIREAIANE